MHAWVVEVYTPDQRYIGIAWELEDAEKAVHELVGRYADKHLVKVEAWMLKGMPLPEGISLRGRGYMAGPDGCATVRFAIIGAAPAPSALPPSLGPETRVQLLAILDAIADLTIEWFCISPIADQSES